MSGRFVFLCKNCEDARFPPRSACSYRVESTTFSVADNHMQTGDNVFVAQKLFCDVCSSSEQVQFPHENRDVIRVAVSVLKQLGWTCSRCRQSVKKTLASDLCEAVASLSTKLSDAMNDIAEIKTSLTQEKKYFRSSTRCY